MTVHFLQLTLPGGKPVMINVEQIVSIAEAHHPGKTNVHCTDRSTTLVNETLEEIRNFGGVQ